MIAAQLAKSAKLKRDDIYVRTISVIDTPEVQVVESTELIGVSLVVDPPPDCEIKPSLHIEEDVPGVPVEDIPPTSTSKDTRDDQVTDAPGSGLAGGSSEKKTAKKTAVESKRVKQKTDGK